jgi:hypothetical protein
LTKIFSKTRSTWPREILRRQVSIFRCSLVTSTHGSVLYIHHGVVLILQPYALELRSNSSAQFLILHRVDSSLSTSSTPMKERDVFESNKHNFKSNTEDQNQSQEFNFFRRPLFILFVRGCHSLVAIASQSWFLTRCYAAARQEWSETFPSGVVGNVKTGPKACDFSMNDVNFHVFQK